VASIDSLLIYLEPSLVARVAAESFEFDSTRTVVPPLDGLKVPELRASAGSSSRKATRFSAPRGLPGASARAAAVISESI
jgi:hypothetical protein